ncbi:uncharacterized protein zgc:112980 [Micropterus salmoides]|uniref:uncharacterized protein zgc:112980 n=1 Tax=Micropterus salmoides TaxID=27706 RepID=UPI0018ED3A64|nr:uncharacterized protein zgc:112980 [Micropterus salmoides]
MCTTVGAGEIIILSDDDDVEECLEDDISCSEPSVLIVDVEDKDVKNIDCALSPTALDEDLVVTFSRRAEVLPHARYDCPIYPFTATDCVVDTHVASNQLMCDQCFCYICDKLASTCSLWCKSSVCHCNSHKRSEFWSNLRNIQLLGELNSFNLTLSEIDDHLRHAETMLHSFRQGLSTEFFSFLRGKITQEDGPSQTNQRVLVYDYTPVYKFVSSFLDEADKQGGRAAAIMRLGAAKEIVKHFQISGNCSLLSPMASVEQAKVALMQRVITSLQTQMVLAGFTLEFTHKLQDFYKTYISPAALKGTRDSLCVRPWDDVLLVSVLKGQNVSGVRKDKGKKDVLIEHITVVRLRTEELQRQQRYRELCRYLRVVQTYGSGPSLQQVQDLIPFFKCMEGDLMAALHSLFPLVNAPASRFTPRLFLFYLRIFNTGTAPKLTVSHTPAQLCYPDAVWEPIKDAVPLTRTALVRYALGVQKSCSDVFNDSECWTQLLTIVNTPCGSLTALPAPSPQFLQEAKDVVNSILLDKLGLNIQIPRFFQEVYPDQAMLLLVTGALGLRILNAALSPAIPVLNTFKGNEWALEWLWESLSSSKERLNSFLLEIVQELENTTDEDSLLPFLLAIVPSLPSSTETWDHTYCSPVAVKLYSSQVKAPSQCQLPDPLLHC